LPVFLARQKIEDERRVRQALFFLRAHLHEQIDLALRDPCGTRRHEAVVERARITVDLAALHGEQRVVLARVADDQLHLEAKRLVHEARVKARRGIAA